MSKLIFFSSLFFSLLSWASQDFIKDTKMNFYIAESVNSSNKNPELLKKLAVGLKNKTDKIKFSELIPEIKSMSRVLKYEAFLNQLRVMSSDGRILFSVELSTKTNHSVLVNGHVEIPFDPNNIWESLSKKSVKSTLYNLVLQNVYAEEKTDAISTAIMLAAIGNGIDKKIPDDYFEVKGEKSILHSHTDPESSLRAVCIADDKVNDKAKSYLKKWDLKIENAGAFYKAQKPNSEVYFKIEKSQSSLPSSADMALCFSLANSQLKINDSELLFRQMCNPDASTVTLGDVKAAENENSKCLQVRDGIADKNILAMNLPSIESVTMKERNRRVPIIVEAGEQDDSETSDLYERIVRKQHFYQNLSCDKIKVEVSKCNKEKCSPSDFAHFAGEFDKSLGDIDAREEKNKKTLIELDRQISSLEQTLKDPNHHSGKELSEAAKKTHEIEKQKVSLGNDIQRAADPFIKTTLNEILNLNAFGKCCANSECKKSMHDNRHLDMKNDKSEPASGKQ